MEEVDEDTLREGRIRSNLDDFFRLNQEETSLQNVVRRAEGLGTPKTLYTSISTRAQEFREDKDVLIVLGQEEDDLGSYLEVKAYSDGELHLAEMSEHVGLYHDIDLDHNVDLTGFELFEGLPGPFKEEKYRLRLADDDYIKMRNGGVVGPDTVEYHDNYEEFEPAEELVP